MSGLLLYLVYFVWLGILIEKTIRHVRQMNIEYIFVTVITLVTIFGAMSAVFTGAFAPDQVRVRSTRGRWRNPALATYSICGMNYPLTNIKLN